MGEQGSWQCFAHIFWNLLLHGAWPGPLSGYIVEVCAEPLDETGCCRDDDLLFCAMRLNIPSFARDINRLLLRSPGPL